MSALLERIHVRRYAAKDDPNAELHVIDAEHFPLDESPDEVRALTMQSLRAHLR
jgi:pimeloyl-ACP methyl ester carboxylesterase